MHPNEIEINDYVDETLDASERAVVDRHLAGCAECQALVEDLRQIRRAAASLEDRQPPVRAWMRIERAIKLEREHAAEQRAGTRRLQPTAGARSGAGASQASGFARLLRLRLWRFGVPRRSFSGGGKVPRSIRQAAWLAAAAVFVLAAAVTLRYTSFPWRTAAPTTAAANPSPAAIAAAQAVESELRAAEQHYENAIKGLEQIATAGQTALDPNTAATVRKNLAVIDQAIGESRAALRMQPASEPAQQSLIESFKAKIALLQDTVALINEMRKGNEAGSGRAASGLSQKGT